MRLGVVRHVWTWDSIAGRDARCRRWDYSPPERASVNTHFSSAASCKCSISAKRVDAPGVRSTHTCDEIAPVVRYAGDLLIYRCAATFLFARPPANGLEHDTLYSGNHLAGCRIGLRRRTVLPIPGRAEHAVQVLLA
jgi:hypothetical protein